MKLTSVILLCTALSASAFAADNTQPSNVSGEIQIPTLISGVVTPLTGVESFCMDGATHLIHSAQSIYRLQGKSPEVTKDLAASADGKTKISVMGYPVWGPECSRISVYSVEAMKLLNE